MAIPAPTDRLCPSDPEEKSMPGASFMFGWSFSGEPTWPNCPSQLRRVEAQVGQDRPQPGGDVPLAEQEAVPVGQPGEPGSSRSTW